MESSWSYIFPEFRLHPFVRFWLKSDTKMFSLSLFLIILKIPNCSGLIVFFKSEKEIKIYKVMPGNMG